jgi:Fic family protein
MFDPKRPYNDLPPLPPVADVETKAVLKLCGRARTALAQLRMADQVLPNSGLLVHTIPLLEAKASSEIENIVTTHDALFREASLRDGEGDPPTNEALRYREALFFGCQALKERPLSTRTAIEICRIIKDVDLDIRATTGTALANQMTGEIIYTPPDGEPHIRQLMAGWDQYWHTTPDVDPLVRMAVLHYQFEAIHPFIDGNGRTGRILNILCLIEAGLIDQPTLYLSRAILATRSQYYRLLNRVTTHSDWEPWICYMIDAVEVTASWTNGKVAAVGGLIAETSRHIKANAPKIHALELLNVIFDLPYCRIGDLVEHGIAKRQAASTYLQRLVEIGVLEDQKVGRDKVFLHRKYFDLLTRSDHGFTPYAPTLTSPR